MIRRIVLLVVCGLAWMGPKAAAASPQAESSARAVRELKVWLDTPQSQRPPLTNASFASISLTRGDAAVAQSALWQDHRAFIQKTRSAEMAAKVIELGDLKMKFETVSFNDTNAPATNGRSLFLSLHGGGGAPHAVNESQWQNQIRLGNGYHPREGIYLAPRAPTDSWDLWHQAHIDRFFDRLIENLVVLSNVNPNRVYVLGYSAGGDGVYQLGPRMADRWAAASMMAGHPNGASMVGLRNVPFAIQVGGNDAAYNRNTIAVEWGKKLDALQHDDPAGYIHFTEIHAGKPHWMNMEDRKAIPWMEQYTRNPLPDKVAWHQGGITHTRFYWLAVPKEEALSGQEIIARREGQTMTLDGKTNQIVTVLLNDMMLGMDQPVIIRSGENSLFSGRVQRTISTLARTLSERGDTNLMFSGEVKVNLP